jgi:solute carrier family 8 (sodium/calcium exchanger)
MALPDPVQLPPPAKRDLEVGDPSVEIATALLKDSHPHIHVASALRKDSPPSGAQTASTAARCGDAASPTPLSRDRSSGRRVSLSTRSLLDGPRREEQAAAGEEGYHDRTPSAEGAHLSRLCTILLAAAVMGITGGAAGSILSVPERRQHASASLTAFAEAVTLEAQRVVAWAVAPVGSAGPPGEEGSREGGGPPSTCAAGVVLGAIERTPLNAALTLLVLLWTFMGVAIGSDVFMMAIEFITSAERTVRVHVDGGYRSFSVLVWNPTIANLTLMALGSSAPEILLSCIEVGARSFYAGELGPSTIVGSAAFNLMVISAVCVSAIPAGESRRIKELPVFYVTASFSVLAYGWLVVILTIHTPNVVDVTEAAITLAAFFALVGLAYLADIRACCFARRLPKGAGGRLVALTREGRAVTADDVSRAYSMVKDTLTAGEDPADAVRDVLSGARSKAFYKLTAGDDGDDEDDHQLEWVMRPSSISLSDLLPRRPSARPSISRQASESRRRKSSVKPGSMAVADARLSLASCVAEKGNSKLSTVSFDVAALTVSAADQWCELVVVRHGAPATTAQVAFRAEGLAEVSQRAPMSGPVVFGPYRERNFVRLRLPPDAPSKPFAVLLENPSLTCELGRVSKCMVTVSKAPLEGPGVLAFAKASDSVCESTGVIYVAVERRKGGSEVVTCRLRTVDGEAVAPLDYLPVDTILTFAAGETRKEVPITIVDDGKYEADETFRVVLSDPTGGATLEGASGSVGSSSGGGGGSSGLPAGAKAVMDVTIISDEEERGVVEELLATLNLDIEATRLGGSDWSSQFAEALELPDCSEGGLCGCVASLLAYLLTVPFKLAFAVPPPPRIMGGWACFVLSLALIGGLTAIIGDLANHVGCCLGVSASTTAITLVALGTSLPDTFASMSAAKNEPFADASIGNITGSNSVNVFLGLGLPWLGAAIYWSCGYGSESEWRDRYGGEPWYTPDMPVGFAVPAGELGSNVVVFTGCALLALGTLMLRRAREGHELGGAPVTKWLTAAFLVLLWASYIAIAILGLDQLLYVATRAMFALAWAYIIIALCGGLGHAADD